MQRAYYKQTLRKNSAAAASEQHGQSRHRPAVAVWFS